MNEQQKKRALDLMKYALLHIRKMTHGNKALDPLQIEHIFKIVDAAHNIPYVVQLGDGEIHADRLESDLALLENLVNMRYMTIHGLMPVPFEFIRDEPKGLSGFFQNLNFVKKLTRTSRIVCTTKMDIREGGGCSQKGEQK